MLMSCGKDSVPFLGREFRKAKNPSPTRCSLNVPSDLEGTIEKIRQMFKKVEISTSAYDTAWVAMVPSREFSNRPCFPQCLDWVVENQHEDGSWGLQPGHPLLVKDFLSSTLACVLALRKWRVGEQLVQRGLDYIQFNSWAVNDKDQLSPIGFDIVFPSMMDQYPTELDLNLPLDPAMANIMLHDRDFEIKRLFENDFQRMAKSLAYFAEGVRDSNFWRWVHLQQRSNGSLFNSPATTAAALIQQYDVKGFQYLCSVLDTYKNWVPTFYPVSVYIRLSMVDTLQRLGVSRYFRDEIIDVLDETYRLWQQKHEEIFSDVVCCAMAFRLLRMNRYEVSSDELAEFAEEEYFSETTSKHFTGVAATLELYRASQLSKDLKEDVLQKIHAWTSTSLKKKLLNRTIPDKQLYDEVEFALENCHGVLERLESRQSIERYDVDKIWVLKTSYRCPNIDNRNFLMCSQQDFNICQALHQKELQELERWYKDCRLDQLKFPRHYIYSSYFIIAATFFEPEHFDARISWAQGLMLITAVDDLFDNRCSREEILNFVELIKVWDGHLSVGYCSKEVEICFTAIHNTIDDHAEKVFVNQGRCVRNQLICLWQETINIGMMTEFEWWSKDVIPTMDEYLSVASLSVGCKALMLTPMYFLGEKLPEDVVKSDEFCSLCSHVTAVARLNNDLQTFKKERAERKVNSVSLQVQSHGSITEEDAITNIRVLIESNRRQLLQMVLQSEGSLLPKTCKDLFWKISKMSYHLYSTTDEFNSPQKTINHINAVIYDPVKQLPPNN